ncbi:hypothetical protein B7494_g5792 [Chlorociboria aeruginascens]|nr:hypothetical protein B7494_g5792 [Chlorociboria aeruginascens]
MSTLPSRTRSLRKPAERSSRHDRSAGTEPSESTSIAAGPNTSESVSKENTRSSQSPSRLPVKPRSTTLSSRPANSQSNASMRPPISKANTGKPSSYYPPIALENKGGLRRSTSNRRPSTSDPVKKERRPSGPEPVKQELPVLKPPSASARHIRNASTSSLMASTRAPGHSRTKSSSSTLNTSTVLRPPNRTSPEVPPRSQQPEPQFSRKPAFSTLQQHFSPAKNLAPKPHPAVFLAPPSPSKLPSNIAISAETAKLQNELLQLHLLHKDAARVEREWQASAKRKLGARFQSVVEKHEALVRLEVQEIGNINAVALKKWEGFGTLGWGLEEKIQTLDEVLTGVWNLGESGGKYAKVVRKFERWLSRCQDVLEMRVHKDMENEELMFVEELDEGWKEDYLVLARKLESWRDHLRELGTPGTGSSLEDVVTGCGHLVNGMLMELTTMAQIEKDAVKLEAEWIRDMNNNADEENHTGAGAVWRSH